METIDEDIQEFRREHYDDELWWMLNVVTPYDNVTPYHIFLYELKRKDALIQSGDLDPSTTKIWDFDQFRKSDETTSSVVDKFNTIFNIALHNKDILFFQLFKKCTLGNFPEYNFDWYDHRTSYFYQNLLKSPYMTIPILVHDYIPIHSLALPLLQNIVNGVKWDIQRGTKLPCELINQIIEYY